MVELQKLDNILLNLVVVFEARRIEGVTSFQAAESAGLGKLCWHNLSIIVVWKHRSVC